jgi:hypothetical protein
MLKKERERAREIFERKSGKRVKVFLGVTDCD